MRKRRRTRGELKFDLSRESGVESSWASFLILIGGTGLFCAAVVFGFRSGVGPNEQAPGVVVNAVSPARQDGAGRLSAEVKPETYALQLRKCSGGRRWSCVVDGDTIWLNGEKIRIADIDTPEISHPKCQKEYELGLIATQRLIQLLNQGEFGVTMSDWPDEDRFGRKLRLIVRGHASLGEQLVREGLAHRWIGHKIPWC